MEIDIHSGQSRNQTVVTPPIILPGGREERRNRRGAKVFGDSKTGDSPLAAVGLHEARPGFTQTKKSQSVHLGRVNTKYITGS
jgi:hypothetical protein